MLKKISCYLFGCIIALAGNTYAKDHTVSAKLDSIPATGFYSILVTPELTGYAKANLSDIRIAGPDGQFVPYIIRIDTPPADTALIGLQILSSKNEKNYTTIVARYPFMGFPGTTGLWLKLNNTTVARYAQLSGSNDNIHWYIIDDQVSLQPGSSDGTDTYTRHTDFPVSNYEYFKIKINNAHTDPIHLVAIRAFHSAQRLLPTAPLQVNPLPTFTQKDSSDHCSYIAVRNSNAYLTNIVDLKIAASSFFERKVTMYVLPSDADSAVLNEPSGNFTLSSAHTTSFILPAQKMRSFVLKIENADNPPLKITGVSTAQHEQYIVSRLEKDKQYTLIAGNVHTEAPQYDLAKFKDSIPAQLPNLDYHSLSAISAEVATAKQETHSYWIWTVIIISVLALSLLTYRLMTDIKKEGAK